MANTVVYSASAGSGKTFSLVCNFVLLLLKQERAYQNVLAVTFTNKATLEMKQRIIYVLKSLAQNDEADDYLAILVKQSGLSEETIRAKAWFVLRNLLHDYSNLHIETIDSFFQRVLRNLSREIGVGSSFNLVLEQEKYTRQAVKNVVKKAEQNSQLRLWLNELMKERIEKGKRWNYEGVLTNFSDKSLNQFVVRANLDSRSLAMEPLMENIKRLNEDVEAFVAKVNGLGKKLLSRCEELNLHFDDFKGKSRGIYSKFVKLAGYNTDTDGDFSVADAENDIGIWLSKTDRTANKEDGIRNYLMPLFKQVNDLFNEEYKTYVSRCGVLSQIYQTGLLRYVFEERGAILREENAFLLSDTSVLLSQMIETPDEISFIYEKIGSRLNHIMVDEFQDTATHQP